MPEEIMISNTVGTGAFMPDADELSEQLERECRRYSRAVYEDEAEARI